MAQRLSISEQFLYHSSSTAEFLICEGDPGKDVVKLESSNGKCFQICIQLFQMKT